MNSSALNPTAPVSEVNAADFFDPKSTTCGIEAAIAALPVAGGRVRLLAGTYVLRDSVYLPSRVSLVGDGPATVLAIRPLKVAVLAKNVRTGQRMLECRAVPRFRVGDGIGVKDDRQGGWWGTHGTVQKIEGKRMWLDAPFNKPLLTDRNARLAVLRSHPLSVCRAHAAWVSPARILASPSSHTSSCSSFASSQVVRRQLVFYRLGNARFLDQLQQPQILSTGSNCLKKAVILH